MLKKIAYLTLALQGTNPCFSQCEDFAVVDSLISPSCYAFSDGWILVYPEGGTAPYEIEILNEMGSVLNIPGSNSASSLTAGTYTVNVSDSDICSSSHTILLENPELLNAEATITNESDLGACDGKIEIEMLSGHDPMECSFHWSPIFLSGFGEDTLNDACAGSYYLTINDPNGCSLSLGFTIGTLAGLPDFNSSRYIVTSQPESQAIVIKSDDEEKFAFELYDLQGKLVFSSSLVGQTNQIEPCIDHGIYIYRILLKDEILKSGKILY